MRYQDCPHCLGAGCPVCHETGRLADRSEEDYEPDYEPEYDGPQEGDDAWNSSLTAN